MDAGIDSRANLLCAILAGGHSRRMGRDKALLKIDGKPVILRLVDLVRPLTDQIVICANDADAYAFLDLPVVPDIYGNQGPLAGLHAAMARSTHPVILLLACDLPYLSLRLLSALVDAVEGYDAVVCQTSDGRKQPLCAVYRRSCLQALQAQLETGINEVRHLWSEPSLRIACFRLADAGFSDRELLNLNSPEDLKEIRDPG